MECREEKKVWTPGAPKRPGAGDDGTHLTTHQVMSAVFVLLAASVIGAAHAFTCLLAVNITMRDGIDLYTCLDFPLNTNATKFDLVMDRSPYGSGKTELIADIYLLEGYVAVRQDQRGTFDSGGHFTMFVIFS